MKGIDNCNLAKELLMVLSYLEDDFIDKLPSNFIENLTFLAADADKEFSLPKNKKLNELNISEECRNWLALLYYQTSNVDKQNELLTSWAKNDCDNC